MLSEYYFFLHFFQDAVLLKKAEKSSEIVSDEHTFEKLNPDKVTTKWNNSYLFGSREDALKDLESLKMRSEEINKTFRPEFENLSGPVLLNFLETEKEFSRSVVFCTFIHTLNSVKMSMISHLLLFSEESQGLNYLNMRKPTRLYP